MSPEPSNEKVTVRDFRELLRTIEDELTHISNEPELSRRRVLEAARGQGAEDLTVHKLKHMVKLGLVIPHTVVGQRDTHLFGRGQIRDMIATCRLKSEKLSYAEILGLHRRTLKEDLQRVAQSLFDEVGVPDQRRRGLFTLRSRVVGAILRWLLRQEIPPRSVVHIRRRVSSAENLAVGAKRVSLTKTDFKDVDDRVGNLEPDDLLGLATKDREVLFPEHSMTNLVPFNDRKWILLSIQSSHSPHFYDIAIGLPGPKFRDRVAVPHDTGNMESEILRFLLDAAMLELDTSTPSDDQTVGNQADHSTPLRSLVEAIPRLSPDWEYCAALTVDPRQPKHLRLSAKSVGFPGELRHDMSVELGQPLTGWAYIYDYPIVVRQTLGRDDPRPAHQAIENATAAIAVPTHAAGRCNGVLYVGTRLPLSECNDVFSEAEIRGLQVLADVVGSTIEANRIRTSAEEVSIEVIGRPTIAPRQWPELEPRLEVALRDVADPDEPPGRDENLYLMAVRCETSAELRGTRPGIADWLDEHLLEVTQEFFAKHDLGRPAVFLRHSRPSSEFICFIPRLTISDEDDRSLRGQLRELLSSLVLQLSYKKTTEVRSFVWSMPFRLSGLLQRLTDLTGSTHPTQEVAEDIVREVEEALVALPRIELAHRYEEEANWAGALAEYLAAHYNALYNKYLIRHVAKMYAATGNLAESARFWRLLLRPGKHKHPRHYSRYAHVLARQGRFEDAKDNYDKAHERDPDNPITLLEWGDLLLSLSEVEPAIEKYKAALRVSDDDPGALWLRLAEARLIGGDPASAKTYANLVLGRRPDDLEARRVMLRSQQLERGSVEGLQEQGQEPAAPDVACQQAQASPTGGSEAESVPQ